MRAKIIKNRGYSFDAEVLGNTYVVESINEEFKEVRLIIDHPHGTGAYDADTLWHFNLDSVELVDEEEVKKFAIGDDVLLRPDSEWAYGGEDDTSNPVNVAGKIIRYNERELAHGWLGIAVQWDNGLANSYREADLMFANKKEVQAPAAKSSKVKQKPKRREQTIVYFVYADGKDYLQRRAKSVVINAENKEIYVNSERSLGKDLVVRENSTVPFKLLEAVRVSTPDGEFCYYFTNGELTGSAREFNSQLPFKTQTH